MGVGTVFYHHQVMLLGDIQNAVHICQAAVQMNRNDRLGALADRRFDLFGGNTVGIRLNVDKDRSCIDE